MMAYTGTWYRGQEDFLLHEGSADGLSSVVPRGAEPQELYAQHHTDERGNDLPFLRKAVGKHRLDLTTSLS